MDEIWSDRVKKYHSMVLKYMKYVLNDHLILALLFFGGGLALAYSNWLADLKPDTWYVKPIILIIGVVLTLIGRPILLFKIPDQVFLIAQEGHIEKYLKRSLRLTVLTTLIPTIFGLILTFPLMAVFFHNIESVIAMTLTVIIGNIGNLMFKYQRFYFDSIVRSDWSSMLIMVLVIGLGIFLSPLTACGFAIIILILRWSELKRTLINKRFDWRKAINAEEERMGKLYHFFSMFTAVKNIQVKVKRRRYADGLVRFLSGKEDLFNYLYARILIRSGNQGSLMLRLLVVGMVVEGYSNQLPLKVIIGALTTYLIVIQLVDVYRPVHENVFIKIYPVDVQDVEKGLLSVMKRIILISAIFLTLAGLITNLSIEFLVISIVAQAITALILLMWFIPRYTKKID